MAERPPKCFSETAEEYALRINTLKISETIENHCGTIADLCETWGFVARTKKRELSYLKPNKAASQLLDIIKSKVGEEKNGLANFEKFVSFLNDRNVKAEALATTLTVDYRESSVNYFSLERQILHTIVFRLVSVSET